MHACMHACTRTRACTHARTHTHTHTHTHNTHTHTHRACVCHPPYRSQYDDPLPSAHRARATVQGDHERTLGLPISPLLLPANVQGDRERTLGLPISPLSDRKTGKGVTKCQPGFYEVGGTGVHKCGGGWAEVAGEEVGSDTHAAADHGQHASAMAAWQNDPYTG